MDKSNYIEIDIKPHTPRNFKPAVQKRLENTTPKPITPEKYDEKMRNADMRRRSIEKKRAEAARQEYERAKEIWRPSISPGYPDGP